MYDPKYDLLLAVGLSLAVSVTAIYVTADNSVNPQGFDEGTLSSPQEVENSELDGGTTTCHQTVTVDVAAHQNSCVQCSLDHDHSGEPSGWMPSPDGEIIVPSPSINIPASI